ncbi:ImmA/IrrE family metallo-endopeptidase [Microbacterium sp. SORGH_AS_0888]|uniref:ImmA/IrrE family metallo-endopeptidase n=1 Tax=Microbacterium sp. SORGH_AS_0888 TaxID=3041791 RepID=UPI00278480EA|nr:ImmA/IrrE family metallo-endopeptidase [Microbacterium sp. SORGH_AS_0888]MDQ1130259.1 Zn-dependent peptidase ImmA (M78 family) [Microbacterium sp. SORGH_AS_0888]
MSSATMTPQRAAQETLRAYHHGGAPRLPVDPVAVARSLGVNVYEVVLPNTTSGMIAKVSDVAGTDILVNSEHAPKRQRFTVAHELGHYIAILNDPDRVSNPFLHKRDSLSSCGTDTEEIFANRFAAELLMPEDEVRRAARVGASVYQLAAQFDVSVDAMNFRLVNLGLARG